MYRRERLNAQGKNLIFEPVHVAQEGRGIFSVETPIRDIDQKIEHYSSF
jgi:hypothetical protein